MSDLNGPYQDYSTNLIYQLLFCDDAGLLSSGLKNPYQYPYDILLSENPTLDELKQLVEDTALDTRLKVYAYKKLHAAGITLKDKILLAVIVEVGLDNGLDVLASFGDGTARYLNHSGKILVWESTGDEKCNELTRLLFTCSETIVRQIGPWNHARRPHPTKGNVRLSFLVSDGLYFGEGPIDVLFQDQLAAPTLQAATQLMLYLTEKSMGAEKRA